MTVVSLKPPPEPEVWQCRCGSFAFWLYATGQAVCADCCSESATMFGCWRIPEKPTTGGAAIVLLHKSGLPDKEQT